MLRSMLCREDGTIECGIPHERFGEALANPNRLLWVDIEGPEDTEIELLLEVFQLHSLTVEDCIMPNVRPKLEEFDRYLFVILQGLAHASAGQDLRSVEVDFCIGQNFLITVRSESIACIDEDWCRAEKKAPMITRGPDFLFYSIADSLFDSYFPFLEGVDAKVDILETKLLEESGPETLRELFDVYHNLMALRRTLRPHREIISRINRREELRFINPANQAYFRDIYDHLLRMNDLVDAGREITMVLLHTHATVASHRLNEIVKTLTALATLAVPMVIVTGVYGMNFDQHLWLPPSAFNVLSVILVLSVPVMFFLFRKYKWL